VKKDTAQIVVIAVTVMRHHAIKKLE